MKTKNHEENISPDILWYNRIQYSKLKMFPVALLTPGYRAVLPKNYVKIS